MNTKITVAVVVIILLLGAYVFTRSTPAAPPVVQSETKSNTTASGPVKEFSMTAYYDAKGKWFSLKDMAVKKGDLVRVKLTNTAGMHDFTIDEFRVFKELPLNQEVTVEFTADKAGSFVYYCSKPGHRAGGQWGTLTVTE